MALPSSVAEVAGHYSALQAALVEQALADLEPALLRGRASPDKWRDAVAGIGRGLLATQLTAASYADAYLNDVLDAQRASPLAEGRVDPRAFQDLTDGGGSWLQGLVFAPNSVRPVDGDWTRFAFVARSIVKTGLTDTARSSTQTAMQTRPAVLAYVRQLRGASCARCVVLAGRRYHSAVPFRRHKRCDCVHVPTGEADADWTTDPKAFFHRLTSEDQDRLFTKAGAEAIRLGADISQVVNARDGITVAQAHGQRVLATTAGTTARGIAGQRLAADSTTGVIRLLPDEIFTQADRLGWDRAEVLRQLRRFAYVL